MLEKKAKLSGWLIGVITLFSLLFAQDQPETDPFSVEALKLRTALHYDSALGAPLDALVRLYSKEKREEELVGLYQAHIAQYPDDARAKSVLARILTALERSEVDEFIQSAARQHPEFSHLQYLLSVNLKKKDEVRSLEALSNAIDLETGKNRRSAWLGELLDRSKTEKGRELATAQLKKLLQVEGQTGQTMLSLGQVMLRHQFWALSLEALNRALASTLNPEERVDAHVLAAKAEAALGKTIEAGKRLDGVLDKLAPDHHRREEVMSLRVSVIASDEERLALLARNRANYEKFPEKENAVLDYVEILIVSGNQDEAIKILKKGSIDLPESGGIEELAIELLEKRTNRQDLIDYLGARLELSPGRNDLRYRLVKAHYEKDDPLAASQDFDVVLASLEGKEKSARILDLARFLRASDKVSTATGQFEAFLILEPTRLDVTRELCEIYLDEGLEVKVKQVLAGSSGKGVEMENLLDLTQFLINEQFYGPAEAILRQFISGSSVLPFEPGLALARTQSELGKRNEAASLLQKLREQTDTPARYKNWLNIGLVISDNFGSLDAFFDSEQSLFSYAGDEWNVPRIEKFLYLCEAGERRQLLGRVSSAIQDRLGSDSINSGMRTRLRQLLVRTLDRDPAKAAEVEEQLQQLAKEDPDRINQYDLQRALLYHRLQRPDLTNPILEKLNLEKVESSDLLRDSYRMLMEYGDRKLAGDALAAVTKLEPSDLFSWERRLSLLAAEGNESDFRAAIRGLIQGIAQRGKAAEWNDDTKRSLNWHLLDSYWRSIAGVLAENSRIEETLPLLDAVEREARGQDLLWINWTRAHVFGQLGREEEKNSAINQLLERLASNRDAMLSFPDGLSTPLASALAGLKSQDAEGNRTAPSVKLPLLGIPDIQWAFEIDPGANIHQIRESGSTLIVLDDRGQVYRVDSNTGKLIWKQAMGVPGQPASSSMSPLQDAPDAGVRKVRQLVTFGKTFVLAFENELRAYACEDGELLWKAPLSEKSNGNLKPSNGATPSLEFHGEGNRLVLFDPLTNALVGIDASTGKWIWENTVSSRSSKPDAYLVSTNTGISVRNGRVLVYGKEAGIYDLETGELQWRFNGENVRVFPVKLREQREDLSEEELVTLEQTKPKPVWKPVASNRKRQHMSYLSVSLDSNSDEIMSFVDYPGSLFAPAADWANRRLVTGQAAHAVLSDDYLWLMDSRGVRLVSLSLPLASQRFDVRGTFLGDFENHSWMLGANEVTHIDGSRGEMNSFSIRNLGGGVEGTLIDGRVYVRGNGGVAVFNAISGKRISGANWDSEMIGYLSSLKGAGHRRYIWQGVVKTVAPGYPAYCHPMVDLVAGGKYYAVFEGNRIVAVSD